MNLFWPVLKRYFSLTNQEIKALYSDMKEKSEENLKNEISALDKKYEINERNWDKTRNEFINEMNSHENLGIKLISISCSSYPLSLLDLKDPPTILYVKGNVNLLHANSVAVVGSRDATARGLVTAKKVAKYFSEKGFVIVSGLALGIDTEGHLGALEGNKRTIAVLAGGLDKISPASNKKLANDILINEGLLVSEKPIKSVVYKSDFIQRNRLQAALSLGTIIVQTKENSGTKSTIKFTNELNRFLIYPKVPDYETFEIKKGIESFLHEYKKTVFIVESIEEYEYLVNALFESSMKRSKQLPGTTFFTNREKKLLNETFNSLFEEGISKKRIIEYLNSLDDYGH